VTALISLGARLLSIYFVGDAHGTASTAPFRGDRAITRPMKSEGIVHDCPNRRPSPSQIVRNPRLTRFTSLESRLRYLFCTHVGVNRPGATDAGMAMTKRVDEGRTISSPLQASRTQLPVRRHRRGIICGTFTTVYAA
jgi:hypothetical protein